MDVVILAGLNRLHFKLKANQVGRQRPQQQIGVLGIAVFDVNTNHQLIVANLLNPNLTPLPHHGETGAGGLQLGTVYVFKD